MKKLILLFFISGCGVVNSSEQPEFPHIVIDGRKIEIVSDEYDNQYLKQVIDGRTFYIPFPFETEEEEEPQLKTLQIKKND